MRTDTFARASAHHAKPLVIRGGLARTFGSLVSFLAAVFLFGGLYLLADAFLHPLDAYGGEIVAAAFSIALAAILFYYLLRPRHGAGTGEAHFRGEE